MESSLSPGCTMIVDVSQVTLYSTPTDLTLSTHTPRSLCSRSTGNSMQLLPEKDLCSENKTRGDDVKQCLSFMLPSKPGADTTASCTADDIVAEFTCKELPFVLREDCTNGPDWHAGKALGSESMLANVPNDPSKTEPEGLPAGAVMKRTFLTSPERSEGNVSPSPEGNVCNITMDMKDCFLVTEEDAQKSQEFVSKDAGQGDGRRDETHLLRSEALCNRTVCLDRGSTEGLQKILDVGVNCTVIISQHDPGLDRMAEVEEGSPDLPDPQPIQQPVGLKQNGTFTADDLARGSDEAKSAPAKSGGTTNAARQCRSSQKAKLGAIPRKQMPLAVAASGKREVPPVRPSIQRPATTQRKSFIRPEKTPFSRTSVLAEKQPAAAPAPQQPRCIRPKQSAVASKMTAPSRGAPVVGGRPSLSTTVVVGSAVSKVAAQQRLPPTQGARQAKTKLPSASGARLPRASLLPVRNRNPAPQPAAPKKTNLASTPVRECEVPALDQAGLPTPIKKT